MKNILRNASLLIMTLSLGSCHNQGNKPQATEAADVKPLSRDSVVYMGLVIYLEPIDSTEFFSLPASPGVKIDSIARIKTDAIDRIDDTPHVYRHDTTLVLRFDNGESMRFISTPNLETGLIYTYVSEIKQLNSYYIKSREPIFDGSNFFVVNKAKGAKVQVFGYPLESPDNKTAICYNFCFASDGASENGFQIFSLDKDYTLDLKWAVTADPSYWGPAECRWKDDQTIYIKSKHVDSKGLQTKYEKLVLPDFSK